MGCSSGFRSCCWTSSAWPARWTGRGSAWTRSASALFGGDHTGANPVDRAKPGCKLHLAVEGGGLPLALLVTGANTNDSLVLEALGDDIPPVRTPAGGRRKRPGKVHADKGVRHGALCDRVGARDRPLGCRSSAGVAGGSGGGEGRGGLGAAVTTMGRVGTG